LFGGGQLGARWQTNGWVFGLEASLALTRLREETQSINVPSGTLTYDTRLRNLTSGTASLGYAFDRTLIYVKGGYVVSRLERDSRAALFPGGAAALASTSERAHGWTLGIGAEYALTNALSLGLEYNVMSLRAHDAATCTTGIGTTFSCGAASAPLNMTGFRSDTQSVGLRLDYKLDGR
jgi:outer membrane immunogenic protein